jgi:hypothetical protein
MNLPINANEHFIACVVSDNHALTKRKCWTIWYEVNTDNIINRFIGSLRAMEKVIPTAE